MTDTVEWQLRPAPRMILHWDKDGTPLETLEWARKFEDYQYRFVGSNNIGPCWISTLWMGMAPTGWLLCPHPGIVPPVYETAVFADHHEIYRIPAFTAAEALEQHQQMVRHVGFEVRRRPMKLAINGHEYRRRKARR
jgi:hypothetical protein